MEIEDVKRASAKDTKLRMISVRITEEEKIWLDQNDISPSLLFKEAMYHLMEKEVKKHE